MDPSLPRKTGLSIGPNSAAPISTAAPGPQVGMNVGQLAQQLSTRQPPTNAQLVGVLQHTDQLLENRKLMTTSREGQKVINDAQRVVEDAQLLITQRNKHEELQEMALHGIRAGAHMGPQLKDTAMSAKGDAEINTRAAKRQLQSARKLVMLIIRSSEFRDAIMDLFNLAQQVFKSGQLGQMVRKARAGKHGLTGVEKPKEGGDLQVQTNITLHQVGQAPLTASTTSYAPRHSSTTSSAAATFVPSGVITSGPVVSESRAPAAGEIISESGELSSAALRRRLMNVLKTLARNPQMQEGVRSIMRLMKKTQKKLYSNKDTASGARKALRNDDFQETLYQAKMLLEEFTNGKSPDAFFTAVGKIFNLVRTDPALRAYGNDWRVYINEGFANPDVFDDDLRLKALVKRGRVFQREIRTHEYTTTAIDEGRELLLRVRNDPIASRFALDLQHLMHDLFMNPSGTHPTLKFEAINTLRSVFVGMFMDELKYIPIPSISMVDKDMEFAIDGIRMTLFDLIPEDIHIEQSNSSYFHPTSLGTRVSNTSQSRGFLRIVIHKRPTVIDNINYRVKRFASPKISDSGIASVAMRRGFTVKVDVMAHYGAKYGHFFVVKDIRARVPSMKLKVRGSRYGFLIKLFKPIINRMMRKKTEQAIEENLWKQCSLLEGRMHRLIEAVILKLGRPELGAKLIELERLVPVTDMSRIYAMPTHDGTRAVAGTPVVAAPMVAAPMVAAPAAPVAAVPRVAPATGAPVAIPVVPVEVTSYRAHHA